MAKTPKRKARRRAKKKGGSIGSQLALIRWGKTSAADRSAAARAAAKARWAKSA